MAVGAPVGVSVAQAAAALHAGQLVAIPTETVYGLAANALDAAAVVRIFEAKNRPSFDPLIVHIAHWGQVLRYARDIPEAAFELMQAFWPGPLTLLLTKQDNIPDIVTAGSPRVALRVPSHKLTLQLLHQLPFPLAAPSANPFGYISPTTPQHVAAQLGSQVAYILDGGPCRVGVESSIVGFDEGRPTLYRAGGVPLEQLEHVLGRVWQHQPVAADLSTPAPGMLSSHYAPRTPLQLLQGAPLATDLANASMGWLSLQGIAAATGPQQILAPTGDLAQAASQLFAAMRLLDGMGLSCIMAELVPETGLGRAINDRLRRAAARG